MFNKLPALAAALVLAVGLTGCGSSEKSSEPTTRAVTDAVGKQTIPADPQRILVLDEYSAVTMLMVGAEPDRVFATAGSPTSQAALAAADVPTEVKTSFLAKPDLEAVAAYKPDLIVASNAGPLPRSIDKFRKIAPTVLLSYGAWRDTLDEAGQIFDRADEADATADVIDARIAAVKTALPRDSTFAVVFAYQGDPNFPSSSAPLSQLVEEVGLERPAAETSDDGEKAGELIVPFSAETLDEHAADRVAVLSGTSYDAKTLRANPLFESIAGSEKTDAQDVDGEAWFGNSAFTAWWVLDDVEALFDDEPVGTRADATDRWDELQAVLKKAA